MKIEVAVPCYNEELTIEKVVRDFRSAFPEAEVVVYDNDSQDNTATLASRAGARVVQVKRRGKGYVVQRIFESSKADIIVLVDGDDTYEAQDVRLLIEPLTSGDADMIIGTRLHSNSKEFRKMHYFGNRLLTWTLNMMFQRRYKDILSGYRAFNRRFMENVPVISVGFEVETELMIQALESGMVIKEIPIRFRQRPSGSRSKLNTMKDGYRIVIMMVSMLRDHQPLFTFTILGILSACIGAVVWIFGFLYAAESNLFAVLRSIGALLIIFTVGLFLVGLILNTINTRIRELSSLLRRKRG